MAIGIFAFEAQAQAISAALATLPAIADSSLQPQNSNIQVPGSIGGQTPLNQLAGVLAVGASMTSAQLQSPSLRQLFFPDLRPLDVSAKPTTPSKYIDLYNDLIPLASGEQLNALITNTAADIEAILVVLTDGAFVQAGGEIQTVKASGTTTLVAGAWTNVPITIAQTLPAGQYQVAGMRAEGANMIAARMMFPGGYWRPGCPAHAAAADLDHPRFRRGGLGVWGQFSTNSLPTIECLSGVADTAETFWLDLIKVSSTP